MIMIELETTESPFQHLLSESNVTSGDAGTNLFTVHSLALRMLQSILTSYHHHHHRKPQIAR